MHILLLSWRHNHMEKLSALLVLYEENPQLYGGFSSHRAGSADLGCFFLMSAWINCWTKKSSVWWFGTSRRSCDIIVVWRHHVFRLIKRGWCLDVFETCMLIRNCCGDLSCVRLKGDTVRTLNNYISFEGWVGITCPFPNVNGGKLGVWEWKK